MRSHTEIGAKLLFDLHGSSDYNDFVKISADTAHYHLQLCLSRLVYSSPCPEFCIAIFPRACRMLFFSKISDTFIDTIELAASLCDIGKIGIPKEILQKNAAS